MVSFKLRPRRKFEPLAVTIHSGRKSLQRIPAHKMTVDKALSFVLCILFCFSLTVPEYSLATLTHDQKKDIITEAYTSLKGLVQTLVDVHTTIQDDVENTTNNIDTLKNSESRSSYAVDVMDTENRQMIAEAARRGTVLSPEEQAVS